MTPAQPRWADGYGKARFSLFEGKFHQCAGLFAELDATANDDTQRLVAREHRSLCAAWAQRDLVLLPR
ncbi:MAG: hypothetical protein MUF54_21140, partial [Polyangiaceae bacterium]|nr:hypothetical protein [Polyangiaceae bacterium]